MTETVSDKPRVAIQRLPRAVYQDVPPFDPPNPVYAAVVRTLELLRLDAGRVGQTDWNPFGRWV
ncbi:MAG: hypothetical protein V3U67_05355, partial [Gemmatimonadota bacterium]